MEADDEVNGPCKSYTTEFRQYDPVVGRWWGVDALSDQMPPWSPYNFVFDNPLRMVNPTGLAPDDWIKNKKGKVEWRDNVNSAEDLDPLSGDQYLGKSGIGLDETSGNTLVYNSDGSIDQGVRSMSAFTVTGEATSHGKVMSNTVVKGMRANSKRIRSEALPFARHMTRSTIDGVGYTRAGISAVGTVVTPFVPHIGLGLLTVGGTVSSASGLASAGMNALEGNWGSSAIDLVMLGLGDAGPAGLKILENRQTINTIDQVVLWSIYNSSVDILGIGVVPAVKK